jgi:hypothetical protein
MKFPYSAIGLLVGAILARAAFGQGATIEAIAESPNQIQTTYRTNLSFNSTSEPRALVQQTDQVLPHIASGGGWETVVVIVNMSAVAVDFTQRFYDESGRPMQVTFRTFPEGKIITTSASQGHLSPNASFNFALFDSTPNLQVGWASLEYDSSKARLGGYSAFRLKAGGVINEGLVPFSSYDDVNFMMPFDNIQGFATGLALCNPGANLTSHVRIVAMDLDGKQISSDLITIPPSGHVSFVLADRMPSLAGRTGTLGVVSDTTRLSAVGIRMNVAGGMTFTSIPVMNWVPGI